ncbi:MAG: PAN domain-containing protein [Planctomycetota bacterium]|jgi:hypothetical protein
MRKRSTLLVSTIAVSLSFLFSSALSWPASAQEDVRTRAPEAHQKWEEVDQDRPGADYESFETPRGLWQCQEACEKDERCKAYTFVKATRTCWLKTSVPSAVANTCCVSGVKPAPVVRGEVKGTAVVPQTSATGAVTQAVEIPPIPIVLGQWILDEYWDIRTDVEQYGETFSWTVPLANLFSGFAQGSTVNARLAGKQISGTFDHSANPRRSESTYLEDGTVSGTVEHIDQRGVALSMVMTLTCTNGDHSKTFTFVRAPE